LLDTVAIVHALIFSGASMGQASKQARSRLGDAAFGFQGDRAKKKKR